MTTVVEKNQDELVEVGCNGLTCQTGFSVMLGGYDPVVVMFEPGKTAVVKRRYADYLVKCDDKKFYVKEPAVVEKVAEPVQENKQDEKQAEQVPAKKGFNPFKK